MGRQLLFCAWAGATATRQPTITAKTFVRLIISFSPCGGPLLQARRAFPILGQFDATGNAAQVNRLSPPNPLVNDNFAS